MKTITILNHKGGVGKTFVAVVLSQLLMIDGQRVAVVDTDAQLNAVDLLRTMDGGPVFAGVDVVASPLHVPDFEALRAAGYDSVIVDTPPNLTANETIQKIAACSDLFVVPFMLNRHSLFAVERTFDLLPDGRPVLPVCSVSPAKTKDRAEMLALVRDQLGAAAGDVLAVVFLPMYARVESNLSARRDFFYRLTENEYSAFERLRDAVRGALEK